MDANRVVRIATEIANCDFRVIVSQHVTSSNPMWNIAVGESEWTRMLVVKWITEDGEDADLDIISATKPGVVERSITLKELTSEKYVSVKKALRPKVKK